jgi:hypothetical protein
MHGKKASPTRHLNDKIHSNDNDDKAARDKRTWSAPTASFVHDDKLATNRSQPVVVVVLLHVMINHRNKRHDRTLVPTVRLLDFTLHPVTAGLPVTVASIDRITELCSS